MGAFLDKPVTEKHTKTGTAFDADPRKRLAWALCAMQGWRMEMEDAHTVETSIPDLPEVAFFSVFDGHGGETISRLSAEQLVPAIVRTKAFTEGDKSAECLSKALRDGVLKLDEELSKRPEFREGHDRSGSTAIMCFVTPTHVIFGNCGDSRGILSTNGHVRFTTVDHKPSDPTERNRVMRAGGFLEFGRVCGNLAVSRALGDFVYKDRPDLQAEEQKICCDSDMSIVPRQEGDEFVVLACDGIWDVMTNDAVLSFVRNYLREGVDPREIGERLLDHCLELNSKDNMSVIIIVMADAPQKEEGYVAPKPSLVPADAIAPPPAGGGGRISYASSFVSGPGFFERQEELIVEGDVTSDASDTKLDETE